MQRDTVIAALMDAFAYRTSGVAAEGCWDCANRSSGLCAEHAEDADRARAFAELAAVLSGDVPPSGLPCLDSGVGPAALPRIDAGASPAAMPRLGAVADYRHRANVAS